jgi:hypothetical protein
MPRSVANASGATSRAHPHTTKHFLPPIPRVLSAGDVVSDSTSSWCTGDICEHQQQYINIKQIVGGVLGGQIWGSASSLCRFIIGHRHDLSPNFHSGVASPPILELGSGTGAVGIWASIALSRQVILTEHRPPILSVMTSVPYNVDGSFDESLLLLDSIDDIGRDKESKMPTNRMTTRRSDRLLRLLRENVELNRQYFTDCEVSPQQQIMDNRKRQQDDQILVRELDWKDHDGYVQKLLNEFCGGGSSSSPSSPSACDREGSTGGFNCIIGSDITYDTSLHDDLARTLSKLLATTRVTTDSSSIKRNNADRESTCWIAHQPRVFDSLGQDSQLRSFQQALQNVGLTVRRIHRSRNTKASPKNRHDDFDYSSSSSSSLTTSCLQSCEEIENDEKSDDDAILIDTLSLSHLYESSRDRINHDCDKVLILEIQHRCY